MTRWYRGKHTRDRISGRGASGFGRLLRTGLLAGSLLGLLSPSSCTTSGVVGGECRQGLTSCDGHCLNLQTDEDNCGSCGHECRSGVTCREGVCGGAQRDGSAEGGAGIGGRGNEPGQAGKGPNGGKDAGGDVFGEYDASYDGGHAAAGNSGGIGGSESTGATGGNDATGAAGGSDATGGNHDGQAGSSGSRSEGGAGSSGCVPPYRTAGQCGDCYTSCGGDTPVCSPVEGEYQCVQRCEDPLTDCKGQCADLESNPDHCGACGRRCPSRLCQAGTCVGAKAGDIVLMCMNLEVVNDSQAVLLGNSVFRRIGQVRILSYDQYASATAVERVADAIGTIAGGRSFSLDSAESAEQVVQDLNVLAFEALIIHDQPDAPEGALGDIGSAWAETLDAFTRAGGTVLVLGSAEGTAEMGELMTNAELLPVAGVRSVTGSRLTNAAPGDAVGNGVISRFLAVQETCAFDTSFATDPENIVVVTTDPNQDPVDPVVVHRVISP